MGKDLQYETEHLQKIIRIANRDIAQLNLQIEESEKDITLSKEGFSDETSHGIGGNFYNAESFEQLVELSQFATQVSEDMDKYELLTEALKIMERLVLSPFFARIDFTFSDKSEPTEIYIGRNSLIHDLEILIHDWRSPIAGLFYRYGLGKATYTAPSGVIEGNIGMKRQYEIKEGKLEYYFDTNVEILDDYLCSLLSKNTSPQMKSIVETIQREQDIAIRDDKNKVLVVQGVAGSGKTSVALHRIAYLMYKGLDDKLDSNDVLIISPNNVFEQYISNVLPELGESNVRSFVLEELFEIVLKKAGAKRKIQSRFQLMDQIISDDNEWIPVMKNSYEFKCSNDFIKILNKINVFNGGFRDFFDKYHQLFDLPGYFMEYTDKAGVNPPDYIDNIIQFSKENLGSRKLFFDDASALMYLYLRQNEYDDYHNVRQVVIDEAQDYYPIHFQILKLLFPKAKFTILGDINQTIHKPEDMGFYKNVLNIINRQPNAMITLNKSFRCTNEIIDFSSKIINQEIKAFGRNGTKPKIIKIDDDKDVDALIADAKDAVGYGHKSIGIICKSMKEAKRLYKRLNDKINVILYDETSQDPIEGIIVLPVFLSKGLEFDVGFVWNASYSNYITEDDRALLFIAATRAMHKLRIYYWEKPSPILPTTFDVPI